MDEKAARKLLINEALKTMGWSPIVRYRAGASYDARPRGQTERLRRFSREGITKRDDNLDIFWLKDESLEDAGDLPDPEDLVSEAVTQLETALDALRDLAMTLQKDRK